jgi:hypothetical protein
VWIIVREVRVGIIDIQVAIFKAGFNEERPGRSPRGLLKTETEFTGFIKTFASLKPRTVYTYF